MAFNFDKLTEIAVPRSEKAKSKAQFRKDNREWLSMSHEIALTLHYYLRTSGMTQKEFAEKLGVSAAYIGKVLKGNENLTLETICKLEKAIGAKFVTIETPYISHITIELPDKYFRFSDDAVSSDRYCEQQTSESCKYGTFNEQVAA